MSTENTPQKLHDHNKLSFMEMCTHSSTGQTSASGFVGIATCISMLICALVLLVYYLVVPAESANVLSFIDKIIILFGIGSALLGTRKLTGIIKSKGSEVISNIEDTLDNKNQ